MHELHKVYRPKRLKDIVGQPEAVKSLQSYLKKNKLPHALLFTGHSGCGKTTMAYVLRDKLGCNKSDFFDMNCSDVGGIDNIRQIRARMNSAPLGGTCRIYYIDECHGLTSQAQDSLLKMLEAPPKHVYFILATTEPNKLKLTIRTRCTQFHVAPINPRDMDSLLRRVLEKEKVELSDEVIERVIQVADGSARKALVILDQIYQLEDEDEQLNTILKNDSNQQAIEIARGLLKKIPWPEMAKLIKSVEEEPETIRRMVLGYMNTILLSGGKQSSRVYFIMQCFRDNFYDCGKAGLSLCCYEVLTTK